MTTALVDGDIVAYRCAASAKDDPVEIACIRADRLMQDILEAVGADEYKLFLSGSRNFRYDIYPEYKANRADKPRPIHLQPVREFLVREWNGILCDGIEADDALGIAQGERSVICTIDKDLLQVPGNHYNFVRDIHINVDSLTGTRSFYKQLILGDKSDNIPGYDGLARVKVPKFLEADYFLIDFLETEQDMYQHCLDMFKGDVDTLVRNARLLYIWRKENDEWQVPTS